MLTEPIILACRSSPLRHYSTLERQTCLKERQFEVCVEFAPLGPYRMSALLCRRVAPNTLFPLLPSSPAQKRLASFPTSLCVLKPNIRQEKARKLLTHELLKRRLTPGRQPINQKKCFFLRLTGRLSRGQPDPHQRKNDVYVPFSLPRTDAEDHVALSGMKKGKFCLLKVPFRPLHRVATQFSSVRFRDLPFGYGFELCDGSQRNIKNTNPAKQRPVPCPHFSLLVVRNRS